MENPLGYIPPANSFNRPPRSPVWSSSNSCSDSDYSCSYPSSPMSDGSEFS